MKIRLGALLTHPVQYYSPWFRHMAGLADLKVYYAHEQTPEGQALAGFDRPFAWDIPLLDGYDWRWLNNISRRPGLVYFDGCDTPEIHQIVAREKFDAFFMIGWNRKCLLQGGWAALRSGTPLIVRTDSNLLTPRSGLKMALKRPVYSTLLPRAGDFISPGINTDGYLGHYGVAPERIHRLPHMIDVDRFRGGAAEARASGRTAALRAEHGAAPGDFILLFGGKLIPKKRPMLLLEALKRLRETHPDVDNVKLWLVGDGPLRHGLEAYIAAHDLPAKLLGFVNQSELPAHYAAADSLVLPSNGEETWGLVINEAFACGLPAIVSAEVGSVPEMIIEGESGWIMHRPDPGELAELFVRARDRAPVLPSTTIDRLSHWASYDVGSQTLLDLADRLRSKARR